MNIERFFAEQIREQKKAASGSFHKRGKGVKHGINGAFRTPYYFMSNKDRKKLNGEVEVTFMYETVIPLQEFLLKPKDLQKTMLSRWREIYSNAIIKKEMGMHNQQYYKLVEELEIPKKERGGARANTGNRKGKVKKEKVKEEQVSLELAPIEVKETFEFEEFEDNFFKPFQVLSTNIPRTSSDKHISVIIFNEDLEQGNPKFYGFRDGMIYDQEQDFKPINRRFGHRIEVDMQELWINQLKQARTNYELLRLERQRQLEPAPKLIPLTHGINLNYDKECTSEELIKLLTKLSIVLEGEEGKYHMAISLSERA